MAQKFVLIMVLLLGSTLSAMQSPSLSMRDYYDLSALEKSHYFWPKIIKDAYNDPLPRADNKVRHILNKWSSKPGQILQTVGSVAKIKFVPHTKVYSGIFSSGALALLYLSVSGDMSSALVLKFLIDDSGSLNLKMTNSAEQDLCLIYGREFACLGPQSEFLAFWQRGNPQVEELAKRSSKGKLVLDVNAPSELYFVPSKALRKLQSSGGDFRQALAALPPGILYEVWTKSIYFGDRWHIADVVLDSKFVASRYADEHLFFEL